MSNKMPSPWSEDFHTGNTTKKIGGDELEHGVIKNTYNKAKEGVYKKVDKIIDNKRQRAAIDAYRAAKTNGRWDLIPGDMRSLITQMSKDGTVIDKFGNTIKLPPITTSGSRWVDHTKGYETTTKKSTEGGGSGKAKPSNGTRIDNEYEKEKAYNSQKNVYPGKSSSSVTDLQRKEREEEQRRTAAAKAKAAAKARQGGRDRM